MGILDGILGAITSPIASLASGVLGAFGQQQTNQTNIDIAQQNSAFNAQQAQENRDFQAQQADITRNWTGDQAQRQMDFQAVTQDQAQRYNTTMSNTAYQRAVNDMKAAGLNPMLAYSQGGASAPVSSALSGAQGSSSTPTGSVASAVQPAPMQNPFAAGSAAAQTAASLNAQYAQTEKMNAEADNTRADTAIKRSMVPETNTGPGSIPAANVNAQTEMYGTLSREAQKRIEQIAKQMDLTTAQTAQVKAQIPGTMAASKITQAEVQRALNEGAAQNSWYNRNIAPYLPDFLKSANSAASAARAFK